MLQGSMIFMELCCFPGNQVLIFKLHKTMYSPSIGKSSVSIYIRVSYCVINDPDIGTTVHSWMCNSHHYNIRNCLLNVLCHQNISMLHPIHIVLFKKMIYFCIWFLFT